MNTLDLILMIIQTAANAASGLTPAGTAKTVEDLAAALARIAQAASTAHQQVTGQPIDLDRLQPIKLVE